MAEQEPAAKGNGNGAASASDEPQVSVVAQYVKDLSVENPSAPQVFQWQAQPSLDWFSVLLALGLLASGTRRDRRGS